MKYLLIVLAIIFLLAGGFFFFFRGQVGEEKQDKADTSLSQTVSLPTEKRPFVSLISRSDGHELKLMVENIQEAKSIDYELMYLAGGNSRGVVGSVDLKGAASFSRDLTLGSCSKNVCKYDEGITGGILTLKLRGEKVQKYETAFLLKTGKEAKNGLVLADGKFSFEGALPAGGFYVLMSTLGVPRKPSGEIIGGPYAIFTAGSTSAKGTIKIKLDKPATQALVLVWDKAGKSWKQLSGFKTQEQTAIGEIDNLSTFLVVLP